MAIQTITYTDKVDLNTDSSIAAINKVVAADMNEIKSVVNNNASELSGITIPEIKTSRSISATAAYSCKYINDCDKYSTAEIKTNKTWTDGKPIYRKVLAGNSLPSDSNIGTINDLGTVISAIGFVVAMGGSLAYSNTAGSYLSPDYYSGVQVSPNGAVQIFHSAIYEGNPYRLTVEYTKSTD